MTKDSHLGNTKLKPSRLGIGGAAFKDHTNSNAVKEVIETALKHGLFVFNYKVTLVLLSQTDIQSIIFKVTVQITIRCKLYRHVPVVQAQRATPGPGPTKHLPLQVYNQQQVWQIPQR